MNIEELRQKLKDAEGYDCEDTHYKQDKALLEYINDKEVTEIFNNTEKWYA